MDDALKNVVEQQLREVLRRFDVLLKFTNAMHGWQNGCCFLDSAEGEPRYYLRCGVKAVKPRGMLNLPNAEFIPSKHYSLT
uniref:Uncharacterized protein n=1 Tax=Trichuris muris TaxID=70415 RepID=A0A5S6Q0R1_TRIMR